MTGNEYNGYRLATISGYIQRYRNGNFERINAAAMPVIMPQK